MIHARLLGGILVDIREGPAKFAEDVPLHVMPSNSAVQRAYTYDAVNQLAVPVVERRPRTLLAIYNAVNALSTANKNLIWTDLTSGSPVKLSQDNGANAGLIFLLWRLASNASLPAATIADMKATAATYYVQDQPTYLVNPPFSPLINIPGDEVVP